MPERAEVQKNMEGAADGQLSGVCVVGMISQTGHRCREHGVLDL